MQASRFGCFSVLDLETEAVLGQYKLDQVHVVNTIQTQINSINSNSAFSSRRQQLKQEATMTIWDGEAGSGGDRGWSRRWR